MFGSNLMHMLCRDGNRIYMCINVSNVRLNVGTASLDVKRKEVTFVKLKCSENVSESSTGLEPATF